ncbi:metal-dependent transcriptional regulator [Pedobacter polysacchareus]|uniref:metal-dependent transcriptional regulator n=1 Tax=Pedobacter polysacchareus TaxID=2861973 RepID=UPI001C99D2A9|nr:metal-dependent transcriptional regulator [Pedobacter polysacchareus]
MISQTEENYLKALFILANENGETGVNELSKFLGIKMPTVTSMMKGLADKNLVRYITYKPVILTVTGKKEAASIIRKHRLTEMYLVEKMGFGWDEVHEIAEQVEHVKSNALFDKMDEALDFPKFDPHGAPIPDKNGKIDFPDQRKLSECKVGETIQLSGVIHSSDVFLKFLNSKNLKLGTILTVQLIEAFDGTRELSYDERTAEILSEIACEKLLVQNLKHI